MKKKLKKINKSYFFFYPGNINTKTGGYIYEKNIFDNAKKNKFKLNTIALSSNYPYPTKKDLNDLKLIIKQLPLNAILIFDGLVFEALTNVINEICMFKIIALIHHPLYLEFKGQESKEFFKKEKKVFKIVNEFYVTSQNTKKLINEKYKISLNMINVVEPGIERIKQLKKQKQKYLNLLTCGSIIERKNYLYLINELRFINNVELNIVGDTSRDSAYYRKIKLLIKKYNLDKKIKFHQNISKNNLSKLYAQADYYISASEYEGFGMALANALLLNKPIISYKTKTIVRTIGTIGILYFKNFKRKNLANKINNNFKNGVEFNQINLDIKKNKRKFLTPNQSANLFIKGIKSA